MRLGNEADGRSLLIKENMKKTSPAQSFFVRLTVEDVHAEFYKINVNVSFGED